MPGDSVPENRRRPTDAADVRHRDRRHDGGAPRQSRRGRRRGPGRAAPRLRGPAGRRRRAGRAHDAGHRDLPARPGRGAASPVRSANASACSGPRSAAGAEFVDVEWRADFRPLIRRHGGSRIVLSTHDFEGIPGDIGDRYRAMRATGAAVVKVAAATRGLCDTLALAALGRGRAGGAPRRHRDGSGGRRVPRPRGALRVVLDLRGRRRRARTDRAAAPARRVPLPRHHAADGDLRRGRPRRCPIPSRPRCTTRASPRPGSTPSTCRWRPATWTTSCSSRRRCRCGESA